MAFARSLLRVDMRRVPHHLGHCAPREPQALIVPARLRCEIAVGAPIPRRDICHLFLGVFAPTITIHLVRFVAFALPSDQERAERGVGVSYSLGGVERVSGRRERRPGLLSVLRPHAIEARGIRCVARHGQQKYGSPWSPRAIQEPTAALPPVVFPTKQSRSAVSSLIGRGNSFPWILEILPVLSRAIQLFEFRVADSRGKGLCEPVR